MAARYVKSGATGTGDGSSWTNAHTTLAAAITASTAGDTFYVAKTHSESQASSMSLSFKGTAASPDTILCVDSAGSVPPVAADLGTGATIATTTSNGISISGNLYCYGVTFNSGSSTGGPNFNLSGVTLFEKCTFGMLGSGGSLLLTGGYNDCKNCSMQYGDAGQLIYINAGVFIWRDSATPFAGATLPSTFFYMGGSEAGARIAGTDLSQLGSGKTIVNHASGSPALPVTVVGCKLGASVTVSNSPSSAGRLGTDVVGCSTTGNVERNERYRYQATQTTETTIVRSGGATDGTTAFSEKVVPTGNNSKNIPFETRDWRLWNDVIGSSKTLTVHIVNDGVTLNNDDIWLEVDYLGSSSTPITSKVSSGVATPLTAGSANPTDSGASWTTTGLTSPVKQSLSVTFTPQMKGPIRWRVKYAKKTGTVYYCPNADLV